MKKNLKTINSILIFTVIFSSLTFTFNEGKSFAIETVAQTSQTTQAAAKEQSESKTIKPATIHEKNAYVLKHMEKSKQNGILKFLIAMIGVVVSALAIFLGLNFYKKFILKDNAKLDNIDYEKTLYSPKDFREAINIFLDKTDK